MSFIFVKTAPVGFEPTTPRLEVWCAIRCATRLYNNLYLCCIYFYSSFQLKFTGILNKKFMSK